MSKEKQFKDDIVPVEHLLDYCQCLSSAMQFKELKKEVSKPALILKDNVEWPKKMPLM